MRSLFSKYPDEKLFTLLREDNTDAFDSIYERYFSDLYTTSVKRLGSREDAQEVVQDVFVVLYNKRKEIPHVENLAGYLHTLLKNKIIDRYRKQLAAKKNKDSFQYVQPVITHVLPETIVEKRLLDEVISKAIYSLPPRCRAVFLMSRMEELSHQSIAQRLSISISTVDKHIGKALKILRKQVVRWQLSESEFTELKN